MRSYSSAISQGSAVMPPTSRKPTDTYAATGMSAIGGSRASATPIAISASGTRRPPRCGAVAPRPLSVCASGSDCAARAGHQPPTPAAATPSTP